MKVRFSRLAVFKLEKLLQFLENRWSEKVKLEFIEKLNQKIQSVEKYPRSFSASNLDPKLRRCVVTKQTSLLYEIQDDSIFILTIIDNRQSQRSIRKEINEKFG